MNLGVHEALFIMALPAKSKNNWGVFPGFGRKALQWVEISSFGNRPYSSKTCMSFYVHSAGALETSSRFNDTYTHLQLNIE